jgi:hypothetical protein
MLIKVILIALLAIAVEKSFKFYDLMGLNNNNLLNSNEIRKYNSNCSHRFQNNDKLSIFNSLDSDMLPDGLTIFTTAPHHPFLLNLNQKDEQQQQQSHLYMLDMNQFDEMVPLSLNISGNTKQDYHFNIFALSMYQDDEGLFKIIAANYIQGIKLRTESFLFYSIN